MSMPCLGVFSSKCFYCFSSQAIKVLNDEMNCDIIKIGSIIRNKVGSVSLLKFSYV
jgi:hypothetical protein